MESILIKSDSCQFVVCNLEGNLFFYELIVEKTALQNQSLKPYEATKKSFNFLSIFSR